MSIFPWILDYIKQKKWLKASTHHSLPPHCGCPMASCLKLLMCWLPPWDRHSPRTLNPLSFSFVTRPVQETHSLNRLSGPTAFVGIFFITARSQETNIAITPGHYIFKFDWNLFYIMLFYVNKKIKSVIHYDWSTGVGWILEPCTCQSIFCHRASWPALLCFSHCRLQVLIQI